MTIILIFSHCSDWMSYLHVKVLDKEGTRSFDSGSRGATARPYSPIYTNNEYQYHAEFTF